MKNIAEEGGCYAKHIINLNAQLFTKPSIAHMLIEEEDILSELFKFYLLQLRKIHRKFY